MKGSLAASIGAVKAIVDSGKPLRGDVVIAAVADEEYGSLGTADILTRIRTDGAIVTEPTALNACLAHKGYLWMPWNPPHKVQRFTFDPLLAKLAEYFAAKKLP